MALVTVVFRPYVSSTFIPRDATQSAVLLRQVVCPSVCDVEVSRSHRLEFFQSNFIIS